VLSVQSALCIGFGVFSIIERIKVKSAEANKGIESAENSRRAISGSTVSPGSKQSRPRKALKKIEIRLRCLIRKVGSNVTGLR
jgi:hypothetical protein